MQERNKINSIIIFFILFITGCAVSNNPLRNEIKRLQRGSIKDDTSFVYSLPFENGIAPLIYKAISENFRTKKERRLILK
jgi:hypothetical protein